MRILLEVEGGLVSTIYADTDIDEVFAALTVWVFDHDAQEAGELSLYELDTSQVTPGAFDKLLAKARKGHAPS